MKIDELNAMGEGRKDYFLTSSAITGEFLAESFALLEQSIAEDTPGLERTKMWIHKLNKQLGRFRLEE